MIPAEPKILVMLEYLSDRLAARLPAIGHIRYVLPHPAREALRRRVLAEIP